MELPPHNAINCLSEMRTKYRSFSDKPSERSEREAGALRRAGNATHKLHTLVEDAVGHT